MLKSMIIEFFGLPNTGKSVLKKELERKGYKVSKTENVNRIKKFFYFLRHFLSHPAKTMNLFNTLNSNHLPLDLSSGKSAQIKRMRNSYLVGVLAKYQMLKSEKKIFVDEFAYQSLFMIFQKKATGLEIRAALNALPKTKYIFLFPGTHKLRYEAYKKPHPKKPGATLLPGSWIDQEYGKLWLETMEHNYSLIEQIIKEDFKETSNFKELKLKYPKIYKRK